MKTEQLKRLATRVNMEDSSRAAAESLIERAGQRGLVDIAYSFVDSPFGQLLAAVSGKGLITLAYPEENPDDVLAKLAGRVSPRILESTPGTDQVRRELDEYFEGRRRRFEVRPDLALMHGFARRVLERTSRIPFGSVSTYREVAEGAGSPRATRAAGNALGANPVPIVVPCHRVLRTGGGLGGYAGGLERKARLLRLEGVLG